MNKNAKRARQLEAIKKKLTAATCMLLVASTMMVSSTYAWFTLSTAPEVTGISTTVGANGSLEIALANHGAGAPANITSAVGDSMGKDGQLVTAANTTWGNLIDLADQSYGLGKITLYPAALNEFTDRGVNKVDLTSPLETPQYGADGRVVEVVANTTYANYKEGSWNANDVKYGVRAIGALSGQSETSIAFNESTAMLAQQARSAKSSAEFALKANGTTLGNIIIRKATDGTDPYTKAEMDALRALMGGYEDALDAVETGLKYVAYGRAASNEIAGTAKFDEIKLAIEVGEELETILAIFYGTETTDADGKVTITPNENFTAADDGNYTLLAAYNQYVTTKANLTKAIAAYDDATENEGKTEFTWEEVLPVLNWLVKYENVKVNGFSASQLMSDEGKQSLINSVVAGEGINVSMPKGSGIVADLADLAGNYYAGIKFDKVSAMGLTVSNVTATLSAETDIKTQSGTGRLVENSDKILNQGKKQTEDSTGATEERNFTDTYAYIVDFYFRTNAQNSYLQLQTTPVDRVYENQEGAVTMGGGSTISFTADSTVFSETQMRALMGCVRLVFIDTETGEILSKATLEAPGTPAVVEGNNITLEGNVYLTNNEGDAILTETAPLTALTANEAKMVSVMVYLDGTKVDNSMVANALTSMTGTLNLQFSSSADLVPMENNQIKELTEEDTNKTPAATQYDVTLKPVAGLGENETAAVTLGGVTADYNVVPATKFAKGETVGVFAPTVQGYSPTVAIATATGTITPTSYSGNIVTTGTLWTFTMPEEAVSVTVTYNVTP